MPGNEQYIISRAIVSHLAERPDPSREVLFWIDADTKVPYISDGTNWNQLGGGGASYPGVTPNGLTPGGLNVLGLMTAYGGLAVGSAHSLTNAPSGKRVLNDGGQTRNAMTVTLPGLTAPQAGQTYVAQMVVPPEALAGLTRIEQAKFGMWRPASLSGSILDDVLVSVGLIEANADGSLDTTFGNAQVEIQYGTLGDLPTDQATAHFQDQRVIFNSAVSPVSANGYWLYVRLHNIGSTDYAGTDALLVETLQGLAPAHGTESFAGWSQTPAFVAAPQYPDTIHVDIGEVDGLQLDYGVIALPAADGPTLATTDGTWVGTLTLRRTNLAIENGLGVWGHAALGSQPTLATGASHTVDDVIALLQSYGFCKQS